MALVYAKQDSYWIVSQMKACKKLLKSYYIIKSKNIYYNVVKFCLTFLTYIAR